MYRIVEACFKRELLSRTMFLAHLMIIDPILPLAWEHQGGYLSLAIPLDQEGNAMF